MADIAPAGGFSGFLRERTEPPMKRNKKENIRLSAVVCAVVTATLAVAAAAAMAAYIIHDRCRRALPHSTEHRCYGEQLPVLPDDEEYDF